MDEEKFELSHITKPEITKLSVSELLNSIRPIWKGRKLIQRVEVLLPVDPSSACQRLFNASIHDLKEKIIVMGADLAKEVASNYKLPAVNNDDDILNYNVSKTIDLSYRIGLLSRAEWRRMHRCYEIRRDLEHEDNEYEAVLEDCFYIFKSTIDTVLSKDPIKLLKITDVKQIVENPTELTISEEFLEDYKGAPILRQKEIAQYLIAVAYDPKQPDIVRENCVEMMRHVGEITNTQVIIDTAKILEDRLGRNPIDLITAKLGHATSASGYFKKVKLKDFYNQLLSEIKAASSDWSEQTKVMVKFEDIGGLRYCPDELYYDIMKELALIYIGEESYGYYRNTRKVFYSNSAAPIVFRLLQDEGKKIIPHLEQMRDKSKRIKYRISNIYIQRRFEQLLDIYPLDEE
ncbi:hypothetical protein [Cloacibacterium sp.]|uniref:hypothetical protein n=1 Tax=Cloacibacterium sp. TaxID=1913682 RepID=UPI0039E322B7